MRIAFDKLTALRLLRAVRRSELVGRDLSNRGDLLAPDPTPSKRWSRGSLDLEGLDVAGVSADHLLHVAVPSRECRLRMRGVTSTVYGPGVPSGSWVDLGNGVQIPCPELLFAQLAGIFTTPALLMLGLELCGNFVRDPRDPRDGDALLWVDPITSAEAIRSFLGRCKSIRGLDRANDVARLLVDGAWSPMEAVLATTMLLPFDEFGYGMDGVILNERAEVPPRLLPYAEKPSRVPDVLLAGTRVGINYDGDAHFELDQVAETAEEAGRKSAELAAAEENLARTGMEVSEYQEALMDVATRETDLSVAQEKRDDALAHARAKIVDDKRRDRDLLLQGYVVLPATSEDLYQRGGLDKLMGQVIELAEIRGGLDLSLQRAMLDHADIAAKRQEVVWSLLPGARGTRLAQELSVAVEQTGYVVDAVIEL